MPKKIFLLAMSFLITACTQALLTTVNVPTEFDDNKIIRDVAYGSDASQKMDIYTPANSGDKKMDVIVFLYGGRWSFGTKEDYQFVGAAFANQGYITVIPDYRKYPAVHFPIFVDDSAKALAWVYDHITAYHGEPDHIFLVGHSAGAHIGALLATDTHYLIAEGKKTSDVIHGFIGLAGPYAFTPDEPDLEDMFGPPANYPKMQATTFVDGHQPPMLLLRGSEDATVKPLNLDRLEQAIRERGGYVQSITYPHTDHVDILGDLTWLGNSHAPVRSDITKYIHTIDGRTVTN